MQRMGINSDTDYVYSLSYFNKMNEILELIDFDDEILNKMNKIATLESRCRSKIEIFVDYLYTPRI